MILIISFSQNIMDGSQKIIKNNKKDCPINRKLARQMSSAAAA